MARTVPSRPIASHAAGFTVFPERTQRIKGCLGVRLSQVIAQALCLAPALNCPTCPSDARRPEVLDASKLSGDQAVAFPGRFHVEKQSGCFHQAVDPTREIPDRIVDVVGVLAFQAVFDGVALHGQEGWDRRDGDVNAIAPTAGHVSFDGDHLIEPQREFGSIGTLDSKVAENWWRVLGDLRVARHQEVDDHIDVAVGHVGFAQQQPGNSAADDRKLALEAAEDLADLDQHGLDCRRRPVTVIASGLGLCHSHGKHFEARCSAASRSRSLPSQRSRYVTIGLVQKMPGSG